MPESHCGCSSGKSSTVPRLLPKKYVPPKLWRWFGRASTLATRLSACTSLLNPFVMPIVGSLFVGKPLPTNNDPTIGITNGFNNDVHADNLVAKVDARPNQRHSFGGTYFFGNNRGTVEDFPELQPQWLSGIHTRAQVVGGNWIWTPSARWVNEARVGYNRLYQPTLPGDLGTPASGYGLNT